MYTECIRKKLIHTEFLHFNNFQSFRIISRDHVIVYCFVMIRFLFSSLFFIYNPSFFLFPFYFIVFLLFPLYFFLTFYFDYHFKKKIFSFYSLFPPALPFFLKLFLLFCSTPASPFFYKNIFFVKR